VWLWPALCVLSPPWAGSTTMAQGVPVAVWAPLTLWALAAFTVVGYIGTVGWVHSSTGRSAKQTRPGRDEAIRLDLESRLVSTCGGTQIITHTHTHTHTRARARHTRLLVWSWSANASRAKRWPRCPLRRACCLPDKTTHTWLWRCELLKI
jgi:hypothetical protein